MDVDLAPALYISRKNSSVPELHVLRVRAQMDIESLEGPYGPAQGKVILYSLDFFQ